MRNIKSWKKKSGRQKTYYGLKHRTFHTSQVGKDNYLINFQYRKQFRCGAHSRDIYTFSTTLPYLQVILRSIADSGL